MSAATIVVPRAAVALVPHGAIDSPAPSSVFFRRFTVTGWAIDSAAPAGTGVDGVYLWAYPASGGPGTPLGWAQYGIARPDISAQYGGRFLNSGYSLATGLVNSSGTYTIVAYVHDTEAGGFSQQQVVTIVEQTDPRGAIDPPTDGFTVPLSFTLTGWAIDVNGPGGVDAVYFWAFPVAGGSPVAISANAAFGLPRTDVEAEYGSFFKNSGFSVTITNLPAGTYRLVPFVHETTGYFSQIQSAVFTVQDGAHGGIDSPAPSSVIPGFFTVTGWAIDTAAATGTGVDGVYLWAYPDSGGPARNLGWAQYGIARPDIAAQYGNRFLNSGYSLQTALAIPPSTFTVVAYVHDTVAGGFYQQQVVTVVRQFDPLGAIDPPANGFTVPSPFTVTGWAWDTDGFAIDAVYFWAFPVAGGSPIAITANAAYGLPRSDVEAHYGPLARSTGFSVTISNLPPGSYRLVPFVHETKGFFQIQSAIFTVQ